VRCAEVGPTVEARFAGVYAFEEGKITSWHLYFDRAHLFSQLGIESGGITSG
jgi:limonene-1,2-epoxide hydrolase